MRYKIAYVFAMALLGPTVCSAISPPQATPSQTIVAKQKAEAVAILRRVQEAYNHLKTFQARCTFSMTSHFQQQTAHLVMNMQVAFRRPQQFSEHMGSTLLDMATVSDGKQVWIVYGKKYLEKPIGEVHEVLGNTMFPNGTPLPPNQIRSPLQLIYPNADPSQMPKDMRLIAYKPLNGKPAYVLQSTETPMPLPAGTKMRQQIWVDAATHFIRRVIIYAQLQGVTMQMVADVQPIVVDKPLPDSLFTYNPPKDAQKVDTLAELMNLPTQSSPNQENADEAAQKRAAKLIGKPAPNFTLKTLDGKTVSLHDLRGKIILLDFSASW